jgi:Rho-binding antiterminator
MINCAQYDYIELACLYHYRIRLRLNSGGIIEGIALDTKWDVNHQECIKIQTNESDKLIETAKITRVEALTKNPHFQFIDFEQTKG